MKVIIYTTPTCVFCQQTKEFFNKHQIEYEEKNVAADTQAAKEMVDLSHQMGVPVVVVKKDDTQEVVVGFDKARLMQILGIND